MPTELSGASDQMRGLTAFYAAVITIGSLVAVYCFCRALGWQLALGTYADWVVAVFTLAAVFTALGIAGHDRQIRMIEREDESKTHARLVQVTAESGAWAPTINVQVVNYGQLPILDVDLHAAHWSEHPRAEWATNWANLDNWMQRRAAQLNDDDAPAPRLAKLDLHREILKPRSDLDDSRAVYDKTANFSVCFLHPDRDEPILGNIDSDQPPAGASVFMPPRRYLQPDMSTISITVRFTTADGIRWQVATEGEHGGEPQRVRS